MAKHLPLTPEMIDAAPFETLPLAELNGVSSNGRSLLPGEGVTTDSQIITVPLSDTFNAKKLVRDYGDRIRHCGRWRKWMIYEGGVWPEDYDGQVIELAKASMLDLLAQAHQMFNEIDAAEETAGSDADPKIFEEQRKEVKALLDHARRSLGRRKIDDLLALARSEVGIPVTPDDFDRHPLLLPVKNGVIDLKTGELLPHDQAFLFTQKINIVYDENAVCPRWERALYEMMGGPLGPDSPEHTRAQLEQRQAQHERAERLVAFLQRSLGYMATADVSEQAMWIFVGGGSNGKSLIIDTLLSLFGDYGLKGSQSLFILKQSEGHPTETASLFGKRLVAVSETKQAGKLDTAFIKDVTGGDRLTARRMREDPWTFSASHHVILATNHLPIVEDHSHGMWRRPRVVPFDVTFVDPDSASEEVLNNPMIAKQNKALSKELQQELQGILNWLIAGCLAWQKNGLMAPPEVLIATENYRRESNNIEAFLKEGCLVGPSYQSRASELFERYERWCKQNEQEPCDRRSFGKQMVALGHQAKKSNGRRIYTGIAARDIESDEDEPQSQAGSW